MSDERFVSYKALGLDERVDGMSRDEEEEEEEAPPMMIHAFLSD